MCKLEIVKNLIEQILEIELVTLDASFYIVDVVNHLSNLS